MPPPHGTLKEGVTTMELFRIKGVLSVKHSGLIEEDKPFVDHDGIDTRRFIVQGVYDTWEIHPASENLRWEASEDRSCKLIIIGRYLNGEELQSGFQSWCV